jgi:hypothetical protein
MNKVFTFKIKGAKEKRTKHILNNLTYSRTTKKKGKIQFTP